MRRKSRLQDPQAEIPNARKCVLLPIIRGYQEAKSWQGGKKISTSHGNVGCEEWFRRFTEISKTANVWSENDDAGHLRIAKSEEVYNQPFRRFGRYNRIPAEIAQSIKMGRAAGKLPEIFTDLELINARILTGRDPIEYNSDGEEAKFPDRKGAKKGNKGREGRVAHDKGRTTQDKPQEGIYSELH